MAQRANTTVSETPASDENLTSENVHDEADTSPRAPEPATDGKRVRAVPYQGGSTIIVDPADFARIGLEQKKVTWDFRVDNFTVKVGTDEGEISQEAADALTKRYPETFEYINS